MNCKFCSVNIQEFDVYGFALCEYCNNVNEKQTPTSSGKNAIPFGCDHEFRVLCDAIKNEKKVWDEKDRVFKEYNLGHDFIQKFEMDSIPHYVRQKGEELEAFTELWEESRITLNMAKDRFYAVLALEVNKNA